jgi:hypothetical protein
MITKESITRLSVQSGKKEIEFCEGCLQGKQTRNSFKSSSTKRANCPGQLVHVDLCGPTEVTSSGGNRYMLLFKDDYPVMRVAYFPKEKSETIKRMTDFLSLCKRDFKRQWSFNIFQQRDESSFKRTSSTSRKVDSILSRTEWKNRKRESDSHRKCQKSSLFVVTG